MESKARVLQAQDCGSLLLARSRAPYLVGCLLPHTALRVVQEAPAKLEADFIFHKGQAALELQVLVTNGGTQQSLHYIVNPLLHESFLESLSEASALYLLTGFDHPVEYADSEQPERQTLYQRVHENGLAVEVTEAVRSQVLLLRQFHAAIPAARLNTSSAIL